MQAGRPAISRLFCHISSTSTDPPALNTETQTADLNGVNICCAAGRTARYRTGRCCRTERPNIGGTRRERPGPGAAKNRCRDSIGGFDEWSTRRTDRRTGEGPRAGKQQLDCRLVGYRSRSLAYGQSDGRLGLDLRARDASLSLSLRRFNFAVAAVAAVSVISSPYRCIACQRPIGRSLRPRFNFDSTASRPQFDSHSSAIRTRYDRSTIFVTVVGLNERVVSVTAASGSAGTGVCVTSL